MYVAIPEVRVGEPQVCGGVTVFPLFAEQPSHVTWTTCCPTRRWRRGRWPSRRSPKSGKSRASLVDNGGDRPALFVEGEEVRGGKQNRVLCSRSWSAGTSRTSIPVACTEPGRWDVRLAAVHGGSCCPPSLRHLLKDGADGRQSRMWATIRRQHRRLGIRSRDGEHVRRFGDAREMAWETCGATCPMPRARRESPSRLAAGSSASTSSTSRRPARRSGVRIAESLLLDAAEMPDSQCQASRSDVVGQAVYGRR